MKKGIYRFLILLIAGSAAIDAWAYQQVYAAGYWPAGGDAFVSDVADHKYISCNGDSAPAYANFYYGVEDTVQFTAKLEKGWKVRQWRIKTGQWGFTEEDSDESGQPVPTSLVMSNDKAVLNWSYEQSIGEGNVDLAVRYDYITYKLHYDLAGGSPSVGDATHSYIDSFVLASAPTKTGYDFGKWVDGKGKEFVAGQAGVDGASFVELDEVHADGSNVVLTASWTAKTYSVTLDAQGGSGGSGSVTATYDVALPDVALPARSGWKFGGYFTEPDGKGKPYYDAQGKGLVPWKETEVSTLHAFWTQKFTVTFYDDPRFWVGQTEDTGILWSEEVDGGASATPPEDPKHEGYLFTGWTGNYQNVRKNEKVLANYSALQYTVRFNANDGSGRTTTQSFTYGEEKALLSNPLPRTGYSLEGWADSTSGAKKYEPGTSVANLATGGYVDLYALWKPISYSVGFDPNGGDGTMEAVNVSYDEAFTVPECTFTKTGCEFRDWSCTLGGHVTNFVAGTVVSNLTAESGAVLTLTANWTGFCIVTFDGLGGTGTMTNVTYEVDTVNRLPSNAFVKVGYGFAGWATNATEAAAAKVAYADEAEVVLPARAGETFGLFAVWTANRYTVRFDKNGGSGTMNDQPFVYGQEQALSANEFSRGEFWTFAGWTNDVAQVGYTNEETVVNLTDEPDGVVTLKAVWETTLTDLSLAMGCDNLIWKSEGTKSGWSAGTAERGGATISCAHSGGSKFRESMTSSQISVDGDLSFLWKSTGGSDTLVVVLYDGNKEIMSCTLEGSANEWHEARIHFALGEHDTGYFEIGQLFSNVGYIADMTWTPEGAIPVQGEPVAVTAATVTDGKFVLSVPGENGIDYGVWTNANLLVPVESWGFMTNRLGDGTPFSFELPIVPELPQLFFSTFKVK